MPTFQRTAIGVVSRFLTESFFSENVAVGTAVSIAHCRKEDHFLVREGNLFRMVSFIEDRGGNAVVPTVVKAGLETN